MNVGDICRHKVVTVSRSTEVSHAAQLMHQEHVGYLVVVESRNGVRGRPVGVLTDRDIVVAIVARKRDSRSVPVSDVMTQPALTVRVTDPVAKALREMRRVGIRRLPVVDEEGILSGIVSQEDVLSFVATELRSVMDSFGQESAELAAVAERRASPTCR